MPQAAFVTHLCPPPKCPLCPLRDHKLTYIQKYTEFGESVSSKRKTHSGLWNLVTGSWQQARQEACVLLAILKAHHPALARGHAHWAPSGLPGLMPGSAVLVRLSPVLSGYGKRAFFGLCFYFFKNGGKTCVFKVHKSYVYNVNLYIWTFLVQSEVKPLWNFRDKGFITEIRVTQMWEELEKWKSPWGGWRS